MWWVIANFTAGTLISHFIQGEFLNKGLFVVSLVLIAFQGLKLFLMVIYRIRVCCIYRAARIERSRRLMQIKEACGANLNYDLEKIGDIGPPLNQGAGSLNGSAKS
jgi:hypothetical protein